MKPKKTISAYILLVGILALSIIGGLLAFGVYSSLVKSQITTEQTVLIKPLDGVIDTKLLDSLQSRRKFGPTELSAEITPVPIPTPTQEILEEASPSGITN